MTLLARLLAVPVTDYRTGVLLLGAKDGVNTVFTTPEIFVYLPGGLSIAVFFNGQLLLETDDFTVSGPLAEQGDTITTLFAPVASDKLWAEYVVSS